MIKSIIYVAVTAVLIFTLSFFEQTTVKNNFETLSGSISVLKTNAENETLTEADVKNFQNEWIKSKEVLHVYIPHNEIKEVDLWISECLYYAKEKDYSEARAKCEVIAELFEQIPKTFSVRKENLL